MQIKCGTLDVFIQDLEKLEKVQRKATKSILRRKKLSYEMRLKSIKITYTSIQKRTRGDMIEIYKIATAKRDIHCCPKLNLRSSVVSDIETRGNIKLIPVRCKYVLRKKFLTNRAVCIWNSLSNNVVSAESVNSFKSRLDRFWSLHDFVYTLQLPSQST